MGGWVDLSGWLVGYIPRWFTCSRPSRNHMTPTRPVVELTTFFDRPNRYATKPPN